MNTIISSMTAVQQQATAARQGRHTIRDGSALQAAGIVDGRRAEEIDIVSEEFSMSITQDMVQIIDAQDPDDPIARQYVPSIEELVILPEERGDPIGDDVHEKVKGVIHRYPDRALLKPVNVCAVYCRFCFRREKVGPGNEALSPDELEAALQYIREHKEIWEVILTGGDPLMLSESKLRDLIAKLSAIEHVATIRIHTRVPVADPKRVTAGLVRALKNRTPVYIVVHCNHPRELTPDAVEAIASFVDNGIPMLSQSVLLRGVNDDPQTLTALFRGLIVSRVKPYYLHHGDLAKGTSHFRTTISEGQNLMEALRGRVSGICQPTYVLDIPGGFGKVPIGPSYLSRDGGSAETWNVKDFNGGRHAYPPVAGGDNARTHATERD